jgi:hypothetical protein
MKRSRSIQIKAALLALIFGLNTVIGFACSINIDMGFNSSHHGHDETEAVVHIHEDGKKHIHYEEKKDHKQPHSHGEDKKAHSEKEKQKDNCCTDQVKKFDELDKSIPQSLTISHPDFLIPFFDVYYNAELPSNDIVRNIKQFVRSYHPPIPDIRIAIQSFQI